MLTLVSGGAASGKSEYAEGLVVSSAGRKIYIATMQPYGAAAHERIARHRALRAGKGFETLEIPLNLSGADVPCGAVVLLECLSNLAANECFDSDGFSGADERIMAGIEMLLSRTARLIIVTNEIFSDGGEYEAETLRYMELLSGLNTRIAGISDSVIEVVCGIPIVWKGDIP